MERGNWYFSSINPTGTILAIDPNGDEFVVKNGDMNSLAGRKLLDAMATALAGKNELLYWPPNSWDKKSSAAVG